MAGLNIQGAIDSAANNAVETMQVKNLLAERYEQFNTKQRQTRDNIRWNKARVNTETDHNRYISDDEKARRTERTNKTAEMAKKGIETPKVKSVKDYVNQKQRLINTERHMDAINADMMVEPVEVSANMLDEELDRRAFDSAHGVNPRNGDAIRDNLNVNYSHDRTKEDRERMRNSERFQMSERMMRMMADQRAKEEAADKIKRKSQAKVKIPTGNPTERGMNFD